MDKVKIIWSDFALDKVEDIGKELEEKSLDAARKVVTSIFDRATQLKTFPLSGPVEQKLKEIGLKHRFLNVYGYKIIYRMIDNITVFITDVFPCKSDPNDLSERAKETKK